MITALADLGTNARHFYFSNIETALRDAGGEILPQCYDANINPTYRTGVDAFRAVAVYCTGSLGNPSGVVLP